MDVSCITMQQIVNWSVDCRSSVSKSGIKSLSCWWSLAYAPRLKNWASGRGVCPYTYPGGTPSIWELWAPSVSPGGTGGVPGEGGAGSGGGAPDPSYLQRVCEFIAMPFWQERQSSIWFSRTKAGCLSIAAFIPLTPGVSTPRVFSSQTLCDGDTWPEAA